MKGQTVQIPSAERSDSAMLAEAMGRNTMDLTWLAQAGCLSTPKFTGYAIQYREGDSGSFMDLTTRSWTWHRNGGPHHLHRRHGRPLAPTRHYRVYAENAKGLSDQFDMAMAMTDAAVEDMPTSVKGYGQQRHVQITVSWKAPADDGRR